MDPQSPSKTKKSIWVFFQSHRIVKICIIFLAILLISVGIYYGFGLFGKINVCYTVVVDCGSTGTRVNVYKWRLNYENIKDLPTLLGSYPNELERNKNSCGYHCMQTEPGLDKFVGNYSGVRNSLVPLLVWAETIIPKNKHTGTPVFVLATAGLRRLEEEDTIRVLDDVKRVVSEHTFKWKRDWIRVLSGKEEAYYGWVALNFKMGYLNSSGLPTLGLLDLGGSSLQVVTETNEVRYNSEVLVSNVGGVEHKLRAYSLPGFGLHKAFDRTLSMLVKVDDSGSYVRHPCIGSKFSGNYTCSSCSKEESILSLVGDPNWEKCEILTQAMVINISVVDWSVPRLDSSCQGKSRNEGNYQT